MIEGIEKLGLHPKNLAADKSVWKWRVPGLGDGAGVEPNTFLSLMVAIKLVDVSPTTSFVMNLRRTTTTVRKGKRCAIAV